MKRIESTVLSLLFLLHCFLIMLLIFESRVSIPYWIQPLGRMHPLILHFPIAFIVLLVVFSFFKNQIDPISFQKINRFLVLITALTTILATIMGLFLSLEGDDTNLLNLHKWIGIGITFLIYGLTFIKKENIFKAVLYISFISVIFAGHYGAGLTHGVNFITEPLTKVEVVQADENTPIFQGFIKPIIDKKCISCHNSEKQKGDLDMTSYGNMKLGGKNGELWVLNNPKESTLLKRIHLPVEHKEHMPPEGKIQLTEEEIALLNAWIKQGATEKLTFAQLPKNDTLGLIISNRLDAINQEEQPKYAFGFANKKDLDALKNPFTTIIQKSPSSPAIDVVIYGRQTYKPEFLTNLSKIKEQIVSLNLSYLPIDKSAIKFISTLPNLEELLLNFTDVKTDDLVDLKECSNLKILSLSGTQIDSDIRKTLSNLTNLKNVFLWNTNISEDDVKTLQTEFQAIYFENGFQDSEDKLQLTPPLLISKNNVIYKSDFIELGHKMPGVEIRYTTDGTTPDTSSTLYNSPIRMDLKSKNSIRAIAYKENWLPSKEAAYSFFDKGFTPEKFELVYSGISSDFIGDAAIILRDNFKASNGNSQYESSPLWATFNDKDPLNATADFGETPPQLNEIVLSYGMSYNQKKEPLETFEIWAGQNKNELTLLKRIKKAYITIDKKNNGQARKIVFKTPKSKFRYYKIIAIPQKKELLYVDQLFFY